MKSKIYFTFAFLASVKAAYVFGVEQGTNHDVRNTDNRRNQMLRRIQTTGIVSNKLKGKNKINKVMSGYSISSKTKKPKTKKPRSSKKYTNEPSMMPSVIPSFDKHTICDVPDPSKIGDGWCDGEPYNTPECDFDGGDCEFDCYGKGNGVCEKKNNNAYCDFDGGDCAEFNEHYPDCKAEYPEYIGDGDCNAVDPYNTTACGYDGGDCLVDGGGGQNKTNTVSIPSSRHLFQIILEYFYPQTEDEILEWQK